MTEDEKDELIATMVSPSDGVEGSPEWKQALFERAYFENEGPFADVLNRLSTGFSVLAYLPGNCMVAAAETVRTRVTSATWNDYLKRRNANETLEQIWGAVSSIVETGERGTFGAIFHNLDFLTDSTHGGVYPSLAAQTAAFGLVEAARNGVVFGMSDREEPELPSAIARAFNDRVRIEQIPYENFHRIMPRKVGEALRRFKPDALSEGTIWLLASRLRWMDPIRAYRILDAAVSSAGSLEQILSRVVASTCSVDYIRPEKAFPGTGEPEGFRRQELSALYNNVIHPYLHWKRFRGSREECMRALDLLPPGAILHGPPGTGKTYLARWIAREIDLPVRIVSGGSLRATGWGEAERNVRTLFREARRAAPCMLVLDDADDLLPDRNKTAGAVAAAERAVVNEFLQQMQGLHEKLEGVLVILTTNREDSLDPAAKARLPVHVRIPYPASDLVPKIVEIVRRDYGYELYDDVRARLVQLFSGPRGAVVVDPEKANDGRFSPRDIRQAMRMLVAWDRATPKTNYKPTLDDVQRVEQFYRTEQIRLGP